MKLIGYILIMFSGMFSVNMLRKKRIKPEQDAKEHILSDKDKAFIEGRQINTFKGKLIVHHKAI